MDFPEGAYTMAPGRSLCPLGAFLFCPSKIRLFMIINQTSKTKKEEMTMATKKSMWILFGILVISAWVLGSSIQAGAETMNYKFYTWMIKGEYVLVGDVEGHTVGLGMRGAFYVFENGEVATINHVSTGDFIKGAGPFMQYVTIKFADGSTIIIKSQGTAGAPAAGTATAAGWTSEIIKGTGRFEGIKGTQSAKAKYLPVEKGEAGPKGYGEGTITYTLPSK
jgi:hypothetical protein